MNTIILIKLIAAHLTAKDIKITEYILIGTFASFTIAILIGFGINWLIGMNF